MSRPGAHAAGRRRVTPAAWALSAVTALLLLAWFVTLAPTAIGGPATLAIVDGVSMEPMLTAGDLAVGRRQARYGIGDLVLYRSSSGGLIIHRIISGSETAGWQTQGDNNSWVDPWVVPDETITGRFWFAVPGVGSALGWTSSHPLEFGMGCALAALVVYLPWRRRLVAPELADALRTGARERTHEGRTDSEHLLLAAVSAGALLCPGVVALLASAQRLVSLSGLVALASLAFTGTLSVWLLYRLYDGRGLREPSRSLHALSGRLVRVDELPTPDEPVRPVASSVELRTLAERYRLPVLHRVDTSTGAHEFQLITVGHGCFAWKAAPARVPVAGVHLADVDYPEAAPLVHAIATDPRHAHGIDVLDDAPLIAMLAQYVHEGAVSGDSVVIAASRVHHRMLREWTEDPYLVLFNDEVLSLITDADAHVSVDRLDVAVGSQIRALAQTGHVRVYGELVGPLWNQGRIEEVLAIEGWWDALRHDVDFDLLCGYGVTTLADGPRHRAAHVD